MKKYLSLLAVALAGGLVALGAYHLISGPKVVRVFEEKSDSTPVIRTSNNAPVAETIDFREAARNSVDAVVHVKTVFQTQSYHNPFGQYFGNPRQYGQPRRGSGSGVIISPDGHIVTNNHVVNGAESIEITLNNNQTYQAKLVGNDPATDLAVLKVDGEEFPTIPLGSSDNLDVGEWVLAVGNPFNLTSTVTAGIVSAKARNINILEYDPENDIFPIESFIQTDAAVNPGNSGGALVNARGELVGINTAIASKTGSYAGYSFAIPSSIVRKVTNDLVQYGEVQRAYIGVSISNISQNLADEQDLNSLEGAYVRGLMEDGAAAEAGLRPGDVIVGVEGISVNNVTELQEQVGKYRPGDEIDINVKRGNGEKKFHITLRNREGNTALTTALDDSEKSVSKVFGASLKPVGKAELERLNLDHGVRVDDLSRGKFAASGIKEGFIITKIDNKPVRNSEDVVKTLRNKKGGTLIEGKYPNGITAYYGFGV